MAHDPEETGPLPANDDATRTETVTRAGDVDVTRTETVTHAETATHAETLTHAEDADATRTVDHDATRTSVADTPRPRPSSFKEAPTFGVGDAFGTRYRILKQLGAGGMGLVFQAWDQTLNIVVALKVIRLEAVEDKAKAAALEKRFKQELLLARQVTHRNVVRIHDLGDVDGTKYITMTFVEGDDLSTILKRDGKVPVERVMPLARQIASGLQAAHEAGVVHRDLKPANIMVDETGQALIMDFGIATKGDADGDRQVIGTLEYMAPEQARGEPVDHRADIYAFGWILTDLLLGRRTSPPGKTPWETLTDRISTPPEPLAPKAPHVTPALDAIILKCLQLAPGDRYETTADLVRALERLDDAGVPIPEARKLTPRLMAIAATVTIGLVGATWWFSRGAAVQPTDPVSVLIADFENQTNDPVYSGLVEQAMAVGVESASFISAYPRRDALRLAATLRPGAALAPPVAKLVSMREGLDVIIGGTVSTDGNGVALRVTAARAENDEVLLDWTTKADSKDQVLEAVGRAAARVRETLGDTKTDSAASEAETFTAASLEAAKSYASAQELQWAGKFEDAIGEYQRTLTLDPNFGRAHAGIAALQANLGRPAEAEASYLSALSHLDRMTEREKFRTRGGYYLFKKNSEKALEEFQALVAQYPADTSGLANLALAKFYKRDWAGAVESGRRASDIFPGNVIRRNNAALFAMYASDFDQALTLSNDVLKINPAFEKAYVVQGLSHLALGHMEDASGAWDRLAALGTTAAKAFAASGRIDLALAQGRVDEALKMIDAAVAEDRANKAGVAAARRLAIKADVLLTRGDKAGALRVAREALAAGKEDGINYLVGTVLIGAGRAADAEALAIELDNRLENDPRLYAALLRGEALLAAGRPRDAIAQFEAAQKLGDSWLGRYSLGRAYLAMGAFPEAASEFDRCIARKGEAASVFLDDLPSYRLIPRVEALLAKARGGLR